MENDMYTVVVESNRIVLAQATFVNSSNAWKYYDNMTNRYGQTASIRFIAKPQAKMAA
jgi:hypothetical protein